MLLIIILRSYIVFSMVLRINKLLFLRLGLSVFLIFMFNQHFLISLIQLEVLTLFLLFILSNKLVFLESRFKVIYIIISLSVIEVALGLRLVVKHARYFNKEFLKFTI